MKGGMDYWLGQLLSLIFYIMTLIVYNRARKEFVNDFVDYFLFAIAPIGPDIITIIKILLKLIAIGVLFFGGLRFFVAKQGASDIRQETDFFDDMDTEAQAPDASIDQGRDGTVVLAIPRQTKKPTLGRYEILGQIGKGAMGIVYKGRDPKLNRLTAIKTIRFIDEYDEDKVEEIKAHFYREAEVVAKMSHKNIVTIFDVGEDLDVSYLAMEYLEGESLEQHTTQNELLPIDACINIIIQACDALDYAHQQGIIHRDVKPGNIMLLENGLVKVMDFGIARAAGGTKTRTGIIKGTPFYMSPEQAKGMTLTGASDIFALGVVFYQLLTGKLPFTGDNLAAIMYQTANTDPAPADSYNEHISHEVLDILNKSLRKNPEHRFKSAKEMADALRKLVSRPVAADSDEPGDIPEVDDAYVAAKSIHGLQQVSDKKLDREEPINFEDLDQVLRGDTVSGDGAGKLFEDTEEGLPEAGSTYSKNIDVVKADKDTKLDLSELREVLAARKKRLALLDGQTPEDLEETDAEEGRDQQESGWVPVSGYGPEKGKRKRSGILVQIAYLVVTLMVLTGAYYYFWLSPNADGRALKFLYYKYFGSKVQTNEMMLENQKQLVQQIMKEKLLEKQRLAKQELEAQTISEEKSSKAEETQKEQQRIIQQKIEDERKKEQQRLAEIEAQKQKERERIARIEAEKQKERDRLSRIAEEQKKAKEEAERLERNRIEALISSDLKKVEDAIAIAEEYRNNGRYMEAKAALETALSAVQESRFKGDRRLSRMKQEIEKSLSDEEIVYGAKGYVLYKDQWLSPQEYENRMYSEGYVKYKNAFKNYKTLSEIIVGKTQPLVNSFLSEKFKDERVHTTNVKFIDLSLKRNSGVSSEYGVDYKWKVWAFKGLNEGSCSIIVSYDVAKDKWYLIKGCE